MEGHRDTTMILFFMEQKLGMKKLNQRLDCWLEVSWVLEEFRRLDFHPKLRV